MCFASLEVSSQDLILTGSQDNNPLITLDSVEFFTNYDSVIDLFPDLKRHESGMTAKYYFIRRQDNGEVYERHGSLWLTKDTIVEQFKARPFKIFSFTEETKEVDSLVTSVIKFKNESSFNIDLQNQVSSNLYFQRPTRVNGKLYYPTYAFYLVIIRYPNKNLICIAKHGMQDVNTLNLKNTEIKNPKSLVELLNWILHFEVYVKGSYPRMKGTNIIKD